MEPLSPEFKKTVTVNTMSVPEILTDICRFTDKLTFLLFKPSYELRYDYS